VSPPSRSPFFKYYRELLVAYGPQGWWPGRTPFEVIVGAILTQNISWKNVEVAISALRRARLLDPCRMRRAPVSKLARLVRPAGYYRQKARKLRAFLAFVEREHRGDLESFLRRPAAALRSNLLRIRGIGPETADSIVLYASGRPSFVVDAYTRRVLARHALIRGREPYEDLRGLLQSGLPRSAKVYGEFHALLVRVGKERCRKRAPLCAGCPLEADLPPGGPRRVEGTSGAVKRRRGSD
jgi:endonuclease III related protein